MWHSKTKKVIIITARQNRDLNRTDYLKNMPCHITNFIKTVFFSGLHLSTASGSRVQWKHEYFDISQQQVSHQNTQIPDMSKIMIKKKNLGQHTILVINGTSGGKLNSTNLIKKTSRCLDSLCLR